MQKRVVAGAAFALLLVGLMATGTASAQAGAPPASLMYGPVDLLVTPDGLTNETTGAPANCVEITPQQTSANNDFIADQHSVLLVHSEPGNFYPTGDGVTLNLALGSASVPDGNAQTGPGVEITGTLSWGGNNSVTAETSFGPGQSPPTASLAFTYNNVTADTGPLNLNIALATTGPATPLSPVDFAVVCNDTGSVLSQFTYARGLIGDGDIDGDGTPDSEDDDRDGDGVANSEEEGLTCGTLDDVNFADDPDLQPAPADSDGDGQTDEFECANAGGNPKSQAVMVPEPAGFPWGLVILLLVILLLIAAIVFIVLKFGRVADVFVVSQDELIVEPGETGKFELAAQSRRSSGDAITLQIAVEGMPEGWDAKTDVDHVTVEPRAEDAEEAETQRFVLTVEAPEHDDPESAVVTVKAIPLNKQGRKDTFKLAAKTQSITSINVPPDAKVPVKRGGPIKVKSGEEEEPMGIPPEGLPLTDLPGLGDATAKKLKAADVETTEQLRTADLTELAKKTKVDAEELGKFQMMSDLIRVPGVSPEEAEVLVENDVGSPKELSEKKPEEIEAMFPSEEPADADIEIQGAGA